MPKLTSVKVNLTLPYVGGIEGVWQPDEHEQRAAWQLYIELVTRIAVAELKPHEGSLREALYSLHALFDITRKILRESGPSVARPKGEHNLSLGFIAVAILNTVLRPVLAKWHPLLSDYEAQKEPPVSTFDHEQRWAKAEELREVLNGVRLVLIEYANLLAQVASVPPITVQLFEDTSTR